MSRPAFLCCNVYVTFKVASFLVYSNLLNILGHSTDCWELRLLLAAANYFHALAMVVLIV